MRWGTSHGLRRASGPRGLQRSILDAKVARLPPWSFSRITGPAVSGQHSKKEKYMSSEDRESQELIAKNSDLMVEKSRGKNAIPERGHVEVSERTGRTVVIERNPSIPKGDK